MKNNFCYKSTDGKNDIHAVIWEPSESECKKPLGIIQIAHGMVEYIDRYDELAEYLNKQGYIVVGNDHLGHGKSVKNESEWGYFTKHNASAFVTNDLFKLTKIMKKKYPDLPYFLFGHSMGSLFARRYIINYGEKIDGAILMGTANLPTIMIYMGLALSNLLIMFYKDTFKSKTINKIMMLNYLKRIPDPKTSHDWLSRDEKEVEKYENTKECSFLFTLNGYKTILSTLNYVTSLWKISRIPRELPILVMSGTMDPVGDYKVAPMVVYKVFKNAGIKDVTLKLYDNMRHEILHEIGKEKVYRDIKCWLDERVK